MAPLQCMIDQLRISDLGANLYLLCNLENLHLTPSKHPEI
jgi:hypothetical protein